MRESSFQRQVIHKIKQRFPEAMVIKNDPDYIQGIPDLLILNGRRWASLEVKRSQNAPHRPNQDYYVNRMNKMSFSRFIYPENREEVLHELYKALGS